MNGIAELETVRLFSFKEVIFMARNQKVRETSRKAQNERRKVERRMARIISEQTGKKVTGKEAVEMYETGYGEGSQLRELYRTRKSLESVKGKNSNKRKGYSVNVEKVGENIDAFTQIYFGRESLSKKGDVSLQRRNKMFERQINQSTMKEGLSTLSRDDSKAFYASTMDLWNGLSNSDNRNAAIMNQFGVNDLSQVYKLLTDKNLKAEDFGFDDERLFQEWLTDIDLRVDLFKRRKIVQEELETIRGSRVTGGTTDDEEYNMSDEKTPETSPEYINRIISRISTALNNA